MKISKQFIVSLVAAAMFAGGCSKLCKAPEQRFAERISEPLNRLHDKGALLAARVIDLQTGEELFSQNPDTPMIPASNGKLAISAAGLDAFGAGYTFKTYLVRDGDDLWIVGSGDPGCGDAKIEESRGRTPTSMFDDWGEALKRRGITKIKGNLLYWDGAFDRELTYPGWKPDFLVDWYAAPVSGLNFNDNCIDVTAYPTEDGQPARLEVVPAATIAKVTNNAVTNGTGAPTIDRAPAAPDFTVSGGVKEKVKLESKPITDPGSFFADSFRTHLAGMGISIAGETRRAESLPFGPTGPNFERIVATHETSITDVLSRINKNSQNLFAEAMSKALGREWVYRKGQSVAGSWALGEEATKQFLWRQRINPGSYVAVDGSGLARENRVTTRLISDLLVAMYHRRDGILWRNSLGVAGVDGTIAKRMKDIQGCVMAKTGYINGVRSLSGYVHTRKGKWIAFSFIYNDIEGSVKPYEALQDDACRVMYFWPDKPVFPPAEKDAAFTTQASTQPTTAPTSDPVFITAPHPSETPTTQP